jgi:tetratricopeptide (TPR) repeat protein
VRPLRSPPVERAWYTMADLLKQAPDPTEAKAALQNAIDLANGVDARLLLAALMMRTEDYAGAAAIYRTLAEDDTGNEYTRYWLGLAQLGPGACEAARETLSSLLAERTDRGEAHLVSARAASMCRDAPDRARTEDRGLVAGGTR